MLVKHVFETNHNALEVSLAALANVVADFAQVDIVESSIDFIHDKERSGMKAVNGKQERKCGDSLFAAAKLIHVAETLHWRHGVELQTTLVRLLRVVQTEIGIPAKRMLATLRHICVNRFERVFNMVVGLQEALGALRFDLQKRLSRLGCSLLGLFVVSFALLQTLSGS